MESNYTPEQWEDYLQLFRIDKKQYLIGVFQKGITFYKQQVRALNIFYGLLKTDIIKPPAKNSINEDRMKICVIGGGIGGMTFAAAALKAGFNVTLLEIKPRLLHMQQGCTTRKIHPNIYDWPEKQKDSLSPYAKLPVLSWKSDTASSVAQQVIEEFKNILKELQSYDKSRGSYYTHCDPEITVKALKDGKSRVTFIQRPPRPDPDEKHSTIYGEYDLLIYAPGYGVEIGTEKNNIIKGVPRTPSYWANDDLAQTLLSKTQRSFVVYGTGDGALIDVFRLKIENFDLEDFVNCLKTEETKFNQLTKNFLSIKDEFQKLENKDDNDWLWRKFEDIDFELYGHVIKNYIEPNWVLNKKVVLIGTEKNFFENISLKKVSLLNAFISFIVVNHNKLKSSIGSPIKYFKKGDRKLSLKPNDIERHIIRFGTDKKKNLRELEIPQKTINKLSETQEKRALYDFGIQLWKYSDIVNLFEHKVPNKKIEYFRPETVAICSNYISILSNILKGTNKGSKTTFRIALHRIIKTDGELCYQQVTSYFDNNETYNTKYRALGSTYSINRGNVGFSIKSGKSLLIKKPSVKSTYFERLVRELGLVEDFEIGKRKSFLSIPILAKSPSGTLSTNMVLYMDSEEEGYFDGPEVIPLIYNSLIGFLESLSRLLNFKQIYMAKVDFEPLQIDNTYSITKDTNLQPFYVVLSSKKEFKYLDPGATLLKTDEFYSYDIVYGHN